MASSLQADPALQAGAIKIIDEDIIRFFDLFLWTFDPRQYPSDRPFATYPFQEELILSINEHIDRGENLLIDKCRDMGATWCMLGVFLYRWLTKSDSFLVGSRKEESVDTIGDMDSLFERFRYMLRTLPDWVLAHYGFDPRSQGYMKIYKENGAQIVGESMNPNFSRQGRYKAILLDEFAFVEKPELIWRACGDSAPCKIPVSTPNGKHNFFAKLRFQELGHIDVISLDWNVHPNKDKEWYEKQKSTRGKKDLAQEVDRSYTVSAGEPFYVGFKRGMHVRKMEISKHKLLIPVFDYGFIHPNCSLHQITAEGIWVIVDNIFGSDMIVGDFGAMVRDYLNVQYSGYNYQAVCYGDPAGKQANDKSKMSSEQILRSLGFPVRSIASNTQLTNYTARKNIIEKKLNTLIGGVPALIVNDVPNNEIIIEGFEGGYRYPDENKYGSIKESPVDDGWYEHPFNTIEYFAVNAFKPIEKPRERRHYTPAPANAGFGF